MSDATFRAQVRSMLAGIKSSHAPEYPEPPADHEGELWRTCTAGDLEPTDARPFEAHLLDAIAYAASDGELRPHRVKIAKGATSSYTETVQTPADEADPRPKGAKVAGTVYAGPMDCPDCGSGLSSRGSDMICLRLDRALELRGTGGIVACGMRAPTDG